MDRPIPCEDCGEPGPTNAEIVEDQQRTDLPIVALHDCKADEWTVYAISV